MVRHQMHMGLLLFFTCTRSPLVLLYGVLQGRSVFLQKEGAAHALCGPLFPHASPTQMGLARGCHHGCLGPLMTSPQRTVAGLSRSVCMMVWRRRRTSAQLLDIGVAKLPTHPMHQKVVLRLVHCFEFFEQWHHLLVRN